MQLTVGLESSAKCNMLFYALFSKDLIWRSVS